MNKHELFRQFKDWYDDGELEKIVQAIIKLPEQSLDYDVLSWLVEAYIDLEEYKKAIAVLESPHGQRENDYKWHFRLAKSLFHAADDEECEDDEDLQINILIRAKTALARGMNMNPPQSVLETADRYMEQICDKLDELCGKEEEEYSEDCEMYDDDELDVIEEHIRTQFGEFPTVCHEIFSPDIHCDICIIPPTKHHNFYTLVTMGMGAHLMNLPPELPSEERGRAELLICLPPDWKMGENSDEWFWPLKLLKGLARLPIESDTWLGWGHSIDNQRPFAPNTELCASLLVSPTVFSTGFTEDSESCELPNGDRVNFFQVIPLYREEMYYKIDNDATTLLERLSDCYTVDVNRPNSCPGYKPEPAFVIDSADDHSSKIEEKGLPLDKINGCNHIAIFMRWCIEHDLVAPEFHENCPYITEGVLDGTVTDLRAFILDYFNGELAPFQLSYMGAAFADYYYNWDHKNPAHFFPADVDSYAEEYYGTERYNSEEFKDEAYMFVPFDEDYYKGLSQYINRAFYDFYPGFCDYKYRESLKAVIAAEKALVFTADVIKHQREVFNEYRTALRNGSYSKLMIIDGGSAVIYREELEEILKDALDPFLTTLAIAKIPDLNEWAWERFGEPTELFPGKDISELRERVKDKFGADPAILTFDGEQSSLCLPVEGGNYLMFKGGGITC